MNASFRHPAHVCVVGGPAVVHLRNPRKRVFKYEASIMFPGLSPTLRGFWHAHEPPRRRVSTHETRSRSCTPTIVPWVAPLGTARLPWWTCGRFPKTTPEATSGVGPRPPATFCMCTCTISTPADHVNASVPPSAHVCVVDGPAAPCRDDPSRVRYLVLSQPAADNVPGHVRLIWRVHRVRT